MIIFGFPRYIKQAILNLLSTNIESQNSQVAEARKSRLRLSYLRMEHRSTICQSLISFRFTGLCLVSVWRCLRRVSRFDLRLTAGPASSWRKLDSVDIL